MKALTVTSFLQHLNTLRALGRNLAHVKTRAGLRAEIATHRAACGIPASKTSTKPAASRAVGGHVASSSPASHRPGPAATLASLREVRRQIAACDPEPDRDAMLAQLDEEIARAPAGVARGAETLKSMTAWMASRHEKVARSGKRPRAGVDEPAWLETRRKIAASPHLLRTQRRAAAKGKK